MKHRTTTLATLLALLGSMLATGPANAAATPPAVRLSGQLVQVADQAGSRFAAIRLAGSPLVPIKAESVKHIASGSPVTVDVLVPSAVRNAAAANRTLTIPGVDGHEIAVPLRASDLAAASDGSPESLTSAIGKATVAEAMAPGTPALEVSNVVTAGADPVSTFTPATRQIYVAVVTPAGATPQPTVDESRIRAQVADASSYWGDVTGGDLSLNVATITGAYTSAYTCSDPWGMWNEAAARVGFNSAPNTSLIIELPVGIADNPAANCGYGLGTIGTSPNDWGALYVADDVWPVLAHELGHNMSFQHADALLCPSATDSLYLTTTGWTGTGCTEDSYGDGQDVMSASPPDFAPFLSAPQSLRTGILAPSAATVIDTAGTQIVTLLPLAGRTGIRTAEVVNPSTGVTYFVEYRTPAGRDQFNVYGVQTGVRVLRYNPATGATVLLDPSPSGQTQDPDPTLPVGQTFTSYDGAVSITAVSANSANAVVSVTIGEFPATSPGAPTAVTATPGVNSATVSWAAPTSDGGAPITGYTVTATPGGRTATTAGGTSTTVTVVGLSNGVAYTFTVTATNSAGTSAASAPSNAVNPAVDTTGPRLVSVDMTPTSVDPVNGPTEVTITLRITDDLSGLAASDPVVIFDRPGSSLTFGFGQLYRVSGDAFDGTYRRTVSVPAGSAPGDWDLVLYPMNDVAGNSAYFFDTIATLKVGYPGAPTAVGATPMAGDLRVSWQPPASDGGNVITGYTITSSPGGRSVSVPGSGLEAVVTGLQPGTPYTFTVTATNAAGQGPPSAPSSPVATPAGVPGAPAAPVASAGNRQATITWTAAGANGSTVTSYVVTATPGGRSVSVAGTARSATVTGLSNGTSYRFSIAAANAVGTGPSVLTTAVIPTDPTAPAVAITVKPAVLTASASATFSFVGTDGTDAAGSLRFLCSRDGATASACTSPVSYTGLSSAVHTFTVKVLDPSGNSRTAAYSWRVDRVAPTLTMTGPAAGYALTTSLAPAWSAKDVGGGLANVDVRWARAAYNGGFTAAVYPSTWQKTTATKATLSGAAPGYTYCFSARARDKAGNVSGWSLWRCSAVALDDRSLTASAGWSRVTSSVFYRSTATVTSRSAVTLTRTGVQAKRIYLVATRCPTCGTVGVYWNGTLIKKVSLYAATTTRRSVFGITTFTGVRSGTLTIRTLTSNKAVQIDGVALVRG